MMGPDSVQFHVDQRVYSSLKENFCGVVEAIMFSSGRGIQYRVEWEDMASRWHTAAQLSAEPFFKGSKSGKDNE